MSKKKPTGYQEVVNTEKDGDNLSNWDESDGDNDNNEEHDLDDDLC